MGMDKALSLKVESTISAYRIVKAYNQFARLCETITSCPIGVTVDTVLDINQSIPVQVSGIALVEFGAHVTLGGMVAAGVDGKGYPVAGITLAGTFVVGTLVGAANTNSIAEVLIAPKMIYGQQAAGFGV